LERVIESHKAGATPADIVDSFDTLNLADVYSVIGFYLKNIDAVEAYLREQEAESVKVLRVVEGSQPARPEFKMELLRRNALLEAGNAEAGR